MHPFLDSSKLTDEQIIERLGKAYSYMNNQVALGHSPTVQSIKEIIQSLEDERASRMNKQMDEEYKRKYPDSHQSLDVGKVDIVNLEEFIRKLV
jgi:nucleoid-associated protein YejK